MIASNKTMARWIRAYFNSWLVNFPVLAENFTGLFCNSSNKMFYFNSKVILNNLSWPLSINILNKNIKVWQDTHWLVIFYANINPQQQANYCYWMKLTNIFCGKKVIENCTTFQQTHLLF